jgi:hypothetical protein
MPVLSTEYARESRHFVLHKLRCNTTITCGTIALGDRIVQGVQQVTQPIHYWFQMDAFQLDSNKIAVINNTAESA